MGRRRGAWMRFAAMVLKPLLWLFTRRTWRGRENVPAGPVILVANHVSHTDPLTLAHFVYDLPREPRYLAKEAVFTVPFVGMVVRGAKQIPVRRATTEAVLALEHAVEAVGRGECVVIYPEGTTTKDPALWPMRGKTGAARLAMLTGAPVVPIGQWGPERFYHPITHRIGLRPRTPVTVVAGPPIDLSAYEGRPPTAALLAEVTDVIMRRIRELVAEARGEAAPTGPLYPRPTGRRHTAPDEPTTTPEVPS
ncbi:MAG: 1-acyl-sn-glycerol-3-phosphate acyltransferase [Actinomycetota bacterium]|nr:1-acyl-sn-glycerol-3-phosphate acyltransferase [Actinomycetota bacterium]